MRALALTATRKPMCLRELPTIGTPARPMSEQWYGIARRPRRPAEHRRAAEPGINAAFEDAR